MKPIDYLNKETLQDVKKIKENLVPEIIGIYEKEGIKNDSVLDCSRDIVSYSFARRMDELLFGKNFHGRKSGTYKTNLPGGLLDNLSNRIPLEFDLTVPFVRKNIISDLYFISSTSSLFLEEGDSIFLGLGELMKDTAEYPLYYSFATGNIFKTGMGDHSIGLRDFLEKSCRCLVYEEDK